MESWYLSAVTPQGSGIIERTNADRERTAKHKGVVLRKRRTNRSMALRGYPRAWNSVRKILDRSTNAQREWQMRPKWQRREVIMPNFERVERNEVGCGNFRELIRDSGGCSRLS